MSLDHREGRENENEDVAIQEVADNVLRAKSMGGMKKMQEWFNTLSPEHQATMIRAEDLPAYRRFIETYVPDSLVTLPVNMMKNIAIFAASVGLLEVNSEILDKSRGISGTAIYKIPDPIARKIFTYLGAPEVYLIWRAGKSICSVHENFAPKIREEVLRRQQNDDTGKQKAA